MKPPSASATMNSIFLKALKNQLLNCRGSPVSAGMYPKVKTPDTEQTEFSDIPMLSVDVSLRPIIFLHRIRHRASGQLRPCLLSMIVCSQGCMCAFAIDQAWRIDVMWLVRLESLILTLDPQGESSSERNPAML